MTSCHFSDPLPPFIIVTCHGCGATYDAALEKECPMCGARN
jgi:rubrerythrin